MRIDRKLILVCIVGFNVGLSVVLATSFLSVYLYTIGVSLEHIGFIYAIGIILAGFLRFPLGRFIDKYGSKQLMIFGAIGYPLFTIGILVARGTYAFTALNIVLELFGAIFWTAFWVYLYDLLVKGKEGMEIAFTGVFNRIPYLVGPVIAGAVIALFGFKNLFYLATIVGIISLILIAVAKEHPKYRPASFKELEHEYSILLHIKRIRSLIIISAFHEAVYIVWSIFTPIYLISLGFSIFLIGIFMAVNTLILILIQMPLGKMIDTIHSKYLIIPGFLISWLAGYLFLMTNSYVKLLLTYSMVQIGLMFNWDPLLARLAEATSQRKHARTIAIFRGTAATISGLTALAAGASASSYGIKTVLFVISSVALAAAIITIFLKHNIKYKGISLWRRHQMMNMDASTRARIKGHEPVEADTAET